MTWKNPEVPACTVTLNVFVPDCIRSTACLTWIYTHQINLDLINFIQFQYFNEKKTLVEVVLTIYVGENPSFWRGFQIMGSGLKIIYGKVLNNARKNTMLQNQQQFNWPILTTILTHSTRYDLPTNGTIFWCPPCFKQNKII